MHEMSMEKTVMKKGTTSITWWQARTVGVDYSFPRRKISLRLDELSSSPIFDITKM